MQLHIIDLLVMSIPLVIALGIALYTQRYVRSVADFMAGGRGAGRYLLATARAEQGTGAVVFVAMFQIFLVSGFVTNWWEQLTVPISMFVLITGFVFYRYRQTRAMTLAQFFEMRYSRGFRLFAGGIAFFAGLLNYGIIPAIDSRFMVVMLGLPQVVHVAGLTIPTYLLLMGFFLTLCILTTTMGGQITILLTDCTEGIFTQCFFVVIALGLLVTYLHWPTVQGELLNTPPDYSLVNPFDAEKVSDFNLWYVLMRMAQGIYSTMAWQNSHAFNASASSPHEARMGGLLGRWRQYSMTLLVTMLSLCAFAYLKDANHSAQVDQIVAGFTDPAVAGKQMRMPVALSLLLPVGIKGAFMSVCLMGVIAGNGIHLHSWSSILIQDIILPLRKKPMSLKTHLWTLRWGIVGMAVWAYLFGALFPLTDYVMLWFQITTAIFIGGAGCAIIGGLYWSRGTTAGAWAGMLVGSTVSVGGIAVRFYFDHYMGHEFFLNPLQIGFGACVLAFLTYLVVSYLTCRQPHNMDKLLHRGEYAVEPETSPNRPAAAPAPAPAVTEKGRPAAAPRGSSLLDRLIGIDANFNRVDRWTAGGLFWWSAIWSLVSIVGSIIYLLHPWSNAVWADFWYWSNVLLPMPLALGTAIWFTVGAVRDMRVFFRVLREEKIDLSDDGTVQH